MKKEQDKTPFDHGRSGSGSAEQQGRDREEQMQPLKKVNEQERADIAESTGISPDRIADLADMGTLSGRDDQAGGSGDQMDTQRTGADTDIQPNNT